MVERRGRRGGPEGDWTRAATQAAPSLFLYKKPEWCARPRVLSGVLAPGFVHTHTSHADGPCLCSRPLGSGGGQGHSTQGSFGVSGGNREGEDGEQSAVLEEDQGEMMGISYPFSIPPRCNILTPLIRAPPFPRCWGKGGRGRRARAPGCIQVGMASTILCL